MDMVLKKLKILKLKIFNLFISFLQWVEKHPVIDNLVLKIIMWMFKR